ncbi:hypothetical protein ACFL5O_12140 [Myxococcota bacterium]
MNSRQRKRALEITWPFYQDAPGCPFPDDPSEAVNDESPAPAQLSHLADCVDLPESTGDSEQAIGKLRDSIPPASEAPEWKRAARALIQQLEALVDRESVDATDQVGVARAWAAWSLGGTSEPQVVRVAHLVSRAHAAIRGLAATGPELHPSLRAAAGVLHGVLPANLQGRMPLQRVVFAVYQLHEIAEPWRAVVEGTAELLGWTDYARSHAAAAIRTAIERAPV